MNDKFKELTKQLNCKLVDTTSNFIRGCVKEDEEVSLNDLLNLILSSHISSIYNNLLELVKIFEAPREPIDLIINKIVFALKDLDIPKYDGDKH